MKKNVEREKKKKMAEDDVHSGSVELVPQKEKDEKDEWKLVRV